MLINTTISVYHCQAILIVFYNFSIAHFLYSHIRFAPFWGSVNNYTLIEMLTQVFLLKNSHFFVFYFFPVLKNQINVLEAHK